VTVSASTTRALPANPHTLAQRIERRLRRHKVGAGDELVLLVNAAPVWPHDPILKINDKLQVRVVPCVSTLAIWEQLAEPHELPTVLLAALPEEELGIGILSRVHDRRVIDMDPWSLIADAFGAQQLDPRLKELPWAGRALHEAAPSTGWPRLPGTVLQRDTALRHLTVQRLHLARLGASAEDIDPTTLLRWSTQPFAPSALDELPEAERDGLLGWLADEFGPTARIIAALHQVGHLTDALPLGLVCETLWAADDRDSLRAQGRVDQYLGGDQIDTDSIISFAAEANRTMRGLLTVGDGIGTADHRQLGHAMLDRAEELLIGFAATGAARHSDVLRSGFVHRLDGVAAALRGAVKADSVVPGALAAASAAVTHLAEHQLAAHYPHRVERAEMALRLASWLTTPVEPPLGVAEAIANQIAQWSWVDLALEHVWIGEDAHAPLARIYRVLHDLAQQRRRDLDQTFAGHLAAWTRSGGKAGDLLTVETVLPRVVAPVVREKEHSRPVLVVVVDGMTAAIAADLADQLTRQGWLEYDPLAARPGRKTDPRRRGVVAALPTVTSVSRASLFAGALCQGGQSEERGAFERNPLWQGRPAVLFHKGTVQGEAGEVLNDTLVQALNDPRTVVGVVVNTVDDALRHGRESADAGWRIDNLGALRALLDYARYQGRAVIITSDHGHVLDRDSAVRPVAEPASARHRTDPAPAGDGEIELTGPRVVADDGRIISLWDPHLRYLNRQAGYHGGASLAEVTIPLLALLPLGAAAPPGWRLLGPQQPHWWTTMVEQDDDASAMVRRTLNSVISTGSSLRIDTKRRRNGTSGSKTAGGRPKASSPATDAGETLFALPTDTDAAATEEEPGTLVETLLASEMFAAQQALTPRKLATSKITGALTALVDANGVLPVALVAERAGEQPTRAAGFVTTLQRIFNVDNFPVLSLIDDGRTVRLDLALLREQFQLPGSRS